MTAQEVVRNAANNNLKHLRQLVVVARLNGAPEDQLAITEKRADELERALSVDCNAHRCDLPVPA